MKLPALITSFFVLTLLTAIFALFGTQESRRAARHMSVWLSLLLVAISTVSGIVWQERTLMRFAKQEGGTIQGLIAKPVPLTTDLRFTPNGRRYLYRGIQIPMAVTTTVLISIALTSSAILWARAPGGIILALWLETLAGVAAAAIYSARRFIQAVELFI
jgi:hypothetical protein